MISCLNCRAAWETNMQHHTTEGFLVLYHKENTIDTLYQELPISVAITFIWNLCPQETGQATMIICSFPHNPKSMDSAQRHSLCNSDATGSFIFGRQRKEN